MSTLPAGMRNNNPGNIKFIGQAGTTPSINTDQGDPQAVYPTAEAGMAAMYDLLSRKYQGGKVTPAMIIAGQGGWTPGNMQAAVNIARAAGIGVNDDIGLTDPTKAQRFMRALMLQEHGQASNAYTDAQIAAAIAGGGSVPQAGGLRHVGGAGSSPANFAAPAPAATAPAAAPSAAIDTEIATLAAQRAARDQSSLADTLASGVGRARSGGRQQQQPVLEQGEASLPPFEFASATPEPVQRQPVQTIQPMSELADLFKVAPVGGAIGVNPATGMPMLPRSRRS